MKPRKYSMAVKASVVCSVLALFAVIAWFNLRGNSASPVISEQPVYHCAFADASFCPTEFTYVRYVTQNDSSDLLDDESPLRTTCAGAELKQPYCSGLSGATLNLFQIYENGKPTLYTRNNYIAYINGYYGDYGPFHESKIEKSGSGAILVFVGKDGGKTFDLLFNKVSGAWKFEWPAVGT